jgi:hypothetical protein
LRSGIPGLNVQLYSHPDGEALEGQGVDRVGVKIDFTMRFGLNKSVATFRKQTHNAPSESWARGFDGPLSHDTEIAELAGDHVEPLG